jgi:hypothetical protein
LLSQSHFFSSHQQNIHEIDFPTFNQSFVEKGTGFLKGQTSLWYIGHSTVTTKNATSERNKFSFNGILFTLCSRHLSAVALEILDRWINVDGTLPVQY